MAKRFTLFLIALSAAFLARVGAQTFLLDIDVSDPSAVKFIATGAFPTTEETSTTENAGIDLLGFFTADSFTNGSVSGNLKPNPLTSTVRYVQFYVDNLSGSAVDLNIYFGGNSSVQNFVTTAPAFTGTATIDLSAFAANLPGLGSSGTIVTGYTLLAPNTNIGSWTVVPEPSTYALLALGLGAVLWRVRRAAQA